MVARHTLARGDLLSTIQKDRNTATVNQGGPGVPVERAAFTTNAAADASDASATNTFVYAPLFFTSVDVFQSSDATRAVRLAGVPTSDPPSILTSTKLALPSSISSFRRPLTLARCCRILVNALGHSSSSQPHEVPTTITRADTRVR